MLRDLYPALRDIVDWHRRGTRYGIQVDPADGLLYAGEPGVQLTWMDAKIGDWVVTPRIGKPVEINALWHFALVTHGAMGERCRAINRMPRAITHDAARVATSFADAFWYADGGYLYDVIDTPQDGSPVEQRNSRGQRADPSLRPNQIFAVSLGTGAARRWTAHVPSSRPARVTCLPRWDCAASHRSIPDTSALTKAARASATRSITRARSGAGCSDPSLSLTTVFTAMRRTPSACSTDSRAHLGEACLGTISEIFDADAPHAPRGCFAQAWSVSETLRAWHFLNRRRSASRPDPHFTRKPPMTHPTAEHARLADSLSRGEGWKKWGPYLSERQWGTVREDYSPHGNAWDYFPHDHARSRAYRWGEDGLAGFSDDQQRLCLGLALWNTRDPILKERLFGLTNGEGNHGEDVKELYYYLDATPTHSYLKMLYKYPQDEFPYSGARGRKPASRNRPARIRADRHGRVRRRPLLRCVRRVCTGGYRTTC